MRATLGVWALPYAFVIQRRNWRDKKEFYKEDTLYEEI